MPYMEHVTAVTVDEIQSIRVKCPKCKAVVEYMVSDTPERFASGKCTACSQDAFVMRDALGPVTPLADLIKSIRQLSAMQDKAEGPVFQLRIPTPCDD